jgi:hypothetical protein
MQSEKALKRRRGNPLLEIILKPYKNPYQNLSQNNFVATASPPIAAAAWS